MSLIKDSLYLTTYGSIKSTFASANCILTYTKDVCNLKMQKLLFLSYGLHLSLYNQKLYGCSNLAWKLGPVVKEVYDEFKTYGSGTIKTNAVLQIEPENEETYFPEFPMDFENEKMSIIAICKYYGDNNSASELVNLTHSMDSWKNAYARTSKEIFDDEILKDFKEISPKIVAYINREFF
jgi:uncharacterized phage-associated protein